MSRAWDALRRVRYALPGAIGRLVPEADARSARRLAQRLSRHGDRATFGYFHDDRDGPDGVLRANIAMLDGLQSACPGAYLSVKAPALLFDRGRARAIAAAAAQGGSALLFDAHAPELADPTLALVEWLADDFPGTGCALPARWQRSHSDAVRLRDTGARIRIVKGEWPDAQVDSGDVAGDYLALAELLAGRAAPVAIASHDPALVERALAIVAPDTPCELEQLRGLSRHQTVPIARRLGVPVRTYIPFGPGWWPYAINRVLARPDLVVGQLRGALGTWYGQPRHG